MSDQPIIYVRYLRYCVAHREPAAEPEQIVNWTLLLEFLKEEGF